MNILNVTSVYEKQRLLLAPKQTRSASLWVPSFDLVTCEYSMFHPALQENLGATDERSERSKRFGQNLLDRPIVLHLAISCLWAVARAVFFFVYEETAFDHQIMDMGNHNF